VIRYIFRTVDFVLTLGVGAIISVALTENKQRIGDIVAGTTLVKTKSKTTQEDLTYVETEASYEPVFKEVLMLKDEDISLIHEVINMYHKTGNFSLIDNTGNRIKAHLDIEIPQGMGMYKFLQTIIKDYSHISAQADVV